MIINFNNLLKNIRNNWTSAPKFAMGLDGTENRLLSSIFSHFSEASDELFRHQLLNGIVEIYILKPSTNEADYPSEMIKLILKMLDNAYANGEVCSKPTDISFEEFVWVIKLHRERGVENVFAFDNEYISESDPALAEILEDKNCNCVRLF